eukprot:CAMPEP_0185729696 /NCGR_PEP_ID=MMETSP1171-20130828/6981_1 /TAXON_ID=374046 /ORGANISM="Helicotheca tamensis, Strain CCMP826" /LENGTH=527 /DNA_ID=CAMNT_0028398597 /DNA_START=31 /DNA_END=1614 /DNA_ORIENTATION=+
MAAAVTAMASIMMSCLIISTKTTYGIRIHNDPTMPSPPSPGLHSSFLPRSKSASTCHLDCCHYGAEKQLMEGTSSIAISRTFQSASSAVLFGIPRGGASDSGSPGGENNRGPASGKKFFGRNGRRGDKKKGRRHNRRRNRRGKRFGGNGGGDDGDPPKTFYPALTRDEIVDKLNVPVFAITDYNGNGAVLAHNENMPKDVTLGGSTTEDGSVYLFLSKPMAQDALKKLQQANSEVKLKVSALHLGKVWFNMIHKDDREDGYGDVSVTRVDSLNDEDGPKTTRKKIHFRIVPGVRDLVGARFLLGMKQPDDFETLRKAMEQSDIDGAKREIQRIVDQSPGFRAPYNEIPVFLMSQMRIQRRQINGIDNSNDVDGNQQNSGNGNGGTPMLPLFLSPKTMIDAYFHFLKTSPAQFRNTAPTLQLVELHKIVEMMQHESEMDFRNVVLFPAATYGTDGMNTDEDDDDESDDDDDGGGDNALERHAGEEEEESGDVDYSPTVECMPFVSMEMDVFDAEGGSMVGQSPNFVPL